MREDQRGPRVGARELERVPSERGDAAAGVNDDRQPALVGDGEDPADRPVAEPEPLGARMQLDPRRAESDGALDLAHRVAVVGIDAAERDQPAVGGLRRGEHPVVGGAIAIGFGEREHDRATVDDRERSQQLIDPEAGPVRIGTAKVRVAVEQACRAEPVPQAGEPRLEQRIGSHPSHDRRDDALRRPDAARPWAGEDVSYLIADFGGGQAGGHR